MKHNLGKLITLILFVTTVLLKAEDFSYTFHVDKTQPYVKEPIVLTLELNQTNPNIVLLFSFDLEQSKHYTFQRIDSKVTDIHETPGLHNAKVRYVYLIYPLSPGEINLTFTLIKKVTTDESVAYSFSGDRDNVKTLVTKDTPVTLPPITLDVKPIPAGTQIVGDFTLDYQLKDLRAKAHEPLAFEVTLKGLGYPPLLELLPQDVNFTLFLEKPLQTSIASLQGTHNTIHYPMAFSHDKNFTLEQIDIKAFNPKNQNIYTLSIPQQTFTILDVDKNTLVDRTNTPDVLKVDWSYLRTAFTYLVVFLAGFLTAISWKQHKKTKTQTSNPLKEKIVNTKDAKALLQLLMATDSHHFSTPIQKLEDSLYGNGKISLSKVKEEAIDLI